MKIMRRHVCCRCSLRALFAIVCVLGVLLSWSAARLRCNPHIGTIQQMRSMIRSAYRLQVLRTVVTLGKNNGKIAILSAEYFSVRERAWLEEVARAKYWPRTPRFAANKLAYWGNSGETLEVFFIAVHMPSGDRWHMVVSTKPWIAVTDLGWTMTPNKGLYRALSRVYRAMKGRRSVTTIQSGSHLVRILRDELRWQEPGQRSGESNAIDK